MGCGSSKGPSSGKSSVTRASRIPGPLSREDLEKRSVAVEDKLTTPDLDVDWAAVSQRGFYPREASKPNQDGYIAQPCFNGKTNMSLFAVLDGHGATGHKCARYCVKVLPTNIAEAIDQQGSSVDYPAALTTAFEKTNTDLRGNLEINDLHSGTTCCAILIVGSTYYVANVGDSRAIVARTRRPGTGEGPGETPPGTNSGHFRTVNLSRGSIDESGRLIAKPLSYDQTPFRKDERDRCKAAGARVLTANMLSGSKRQSEDFNEPGENEFDKEGDPPRIWLKSRASPGTAFSRSFGDGEAESVGVCATPEIEQREVRKEDVFIMIASDGVFEFLTNQNVSDVVVRSMQENNSHLEACRTVVTEAYAQWMTWDVRSDDITMIILNVGGSGVEEESEAARGRGGSVDMSRFEGVKSPNTAAMAEALGANEGEGNPSPSQNGGFFGLFSGPPSPPSAEEESEQASPTGRVRAGSLAPGTTLDTTGVNQV